MEVNDLEKAINSAKSLGDRDNVGANISKEEEIGFHKGSLNTLAAERNELVKMVGNVEGIMSAHIKRLKELGVDVSGKG